MSTLIENVKSALYDGRTDIILALLKTQLNDIDDDKIIHCNIDSDGTMLHIASKLGNQDLIRALLMCNADTALLNDQGLTPIKINPSLKVQQIYIDELFRRISRNDLEYINKLFKGGLNINISIPSLDHNTCLHWAAIFSSPDVVAYLYTKGANLEVENDKGLTPLQEAILANKVDNVQKLLDLKADCTTTLSNGKFAGKSTLQLTIGQDPKIGVMIRETLDKVRRNSQTQPMPSINGNGTDDGMDLDQMTITGGDQKVAETNNVTPCGSAPKQLTEVEMGERTFLKVLWPRPRQVFMAQDEHESFVLPPNVNVCLISHLASVTCIRMWEVWEIFRESFSGLGSVLLMQPPSMRTESNIVCLLDDRIFPKEQGYKLVVTHKQIKLIARDIPGIYYGISTIREILRASPEFILPQFTIIDWPAYMTRGIIMDISLNKVPKIGGLTRIIDSLAGLKINKIFLYTVFGDEEELNGELVRDWQVAYSPMDILFLERYCQECCVTLVPAIEVRSQLPTQEYLKFLRPAIQKFLNSFTSYKEIYGGPRLCNALATTPSSTGREPDSSITRGFDSFFTPPQRSNGFSLLLDCSLIKGEGAINTLLEALGPDTTIALQSGNQNSKAISHAIRNQGLTHLTIVDSVWGRSVAGNYKCDFPYDKSAGLCAPSQFVASDEEMDLQGVVANLCCTGPPLFVDYVFAWPMLLALASQAWSNKSNLSSTGEENALASILSWYVFPQDVECTLSKALLELGNLEYDLTSLPENLNLQSCEALKVRTEKILPEPSFFYNILSRPAEIDLKHFTAEVYNKALKTLKRIQSGLVAFQKPQHFALGVSPDPKDDRLPSYVIAVELMTFGCRLAKCLVVAGTNPEPLSPSNVPSSTEIINVGLANINAIHKTDLANKLLDIIKLFKANWSQQNLDENMGPTVSVLEKLFRQLAPDSDAKI